MVIASFLQGPLEITELIDWQWILHKGSKSRTALLHQEACAIFYYVSTDSLVTMQRLLLLSSQ
jgi:hypothetical protein